MIRKCLIGVAAYAAICLAAIVQPPFFVRIVEALPNSVAGLLALSVLTFIGPGILFTKGSVALPWFVAILIVVAACVWRSTVLWRRYPDSEVFVVFVIAAVMLWMGPGLMLFLDHVI